MNIEALLTPKEAIPLLAECALPTEDISASPSLRLFGVRANGRWVGIVGLELYAPVAMLRSLAVAPAFRNQGMAHALVLFAEAFAAGQGVEKLFLLTTSAERFFLKLGYATASRTAAPAAIQATAQFSGLCPSNSAFLSKTVRADPMRQETTASEPAAPPVRAR